MQLQGQQRQIEARMKKDRNQDRRKREAYPRPVPVAAMVRSFMGAMAAKGQGEADFFAYVTLMEDLAGRAR